MFKRLPSNQCLILFLIGTILFALGTRFLRTDLTPFINDEPKLQLKLDEHFKEKTTPTLGLSGSQPIPYGPVPLWAYTVVRSVSEKHSSLIQVQTVLQTGALLVFFVLLIRLFGLITALIATLPAATSPFLFFYSRIAWDNTFLIVWSTGLACLFYLLRKDFHRFSVWMTFGILAAFSIGTHLMILPLIGLLYGVLGLQVLSQSTKSAQKPFAIAGLFVSLCICILVLLPYLLAVGSGWTQAASPNMHTDFVHLASHSWVALKNTTVFWSYDSFWKYFFYPDAGEWFKTESWMPSILRMGEIATTGLRFSAIFGSLALLLIGALRKTPADSRRKFAAVGLLCLFTTSFVYSYKGLFQHPHYFHYLWWAPTLLLAFILAESKNRWISTGVASLAILTSLINFSLILFSGSFISENSGTRTVGYSVTSSAQMEIVENLCRLASREKATHEVTQKTEVDISQIQVFPKSLQYFSLREPNCENITLEFHKIIRGTEKYQLVYSGESITDANLIIQLTRLQRKQ